MMASPKQSITEAQLAVLFGRCGRIKGAVKLALTDHLLHGESLYASARKYDVDRSNLYDKLKQMGLR